LLTSQPGPDCAFKSSGDSETKDTMLMKLDYERQCYRQAEMIVRNRLQRLQGAVDETIKVLKIKSRNLGEIP
jgi:hypothetical protein